MHPLRRSGGTAGIDSSPRRCRSSQRFDVLEQRPAGCRRPGRISSCLDLRSPGPGYAVIEQRERLGPAETPPGATVATPSSLVTGPGGQHHRRGFGAEAASTRRTRSGTDGSSSHCRSSTTTSSGDDVSDTSHEEAQERCAEEQVAAGIAGRDPEGDRQRPALVGRKAREQVLHRLDQRAEARVGHVRLASHPGRAQDPDVPRAGPGIPQTIEQVGLPDPGVPDELHHRGLAAHRGSDDVVQQSPLGLTSGQHAPMMRVLRIPRKRARRRDRHGERSAVRVTAPSPPGASMKTSARIAVTLGSAALVAAAVLQGAGSGVGLARSHPLVHEPAGQPPVLVQAHPGTPAAGDASYIASHVVVRRARHAPPPACVLVTPGQRRGASRARSTSLLSHGTITTRGITNLASHGRRPRRHRGNGPATSERTDSRHA